VRGTVAPFHPGAFVRLEDANGNDAGISAGINGQSGRFLLAGVPAGAWRIVGQDEQLSGEETVEVNSADVTNLMLHLEALSNLPVEIVGAEPGETPVLPLRLIRDDNTMQDSGFGPTEYGAMPVNGTGETGKIPALQFANVAPGHYVLRAQSSGPGNCIDSVRFGNSDVERDGISVVPGQASQPIRVFMRSDCASVQVKLARPEEAQTAWVLLLSDNPVFELMTNVSGSGMIQFPSLAPGKYRLYAFEDAENLEYSNPQVLSAFEAREVTLNSNQKAEVTLDPVKRVTEGGSPGGNAR
jgi:hypothetical protein